MVPAQLPSYARAVAHSRIRRVAGRVGKTNDFVVKGLDKNTGNFVRQGSRKNLGFVRQGSRQQPDNSLFISILEKTGNLFRQGSREHLGTFFVKGLEHISELFSSRA